MPLPSAECADHHEHDAAISPYIVVVMLTVMTIVRHCKVPFLLHQGMMFHTNNRSGRFGRLYERIAPVVRYRRRRLSGWAVDTVPV
jgi:hypothetical protein